MRTNIEADKHECENWANVYNAEIIGCTLKLINIPLMHRNGVNKIINATECRSIDLVVAESIDYFRRKHSEFEPFLKRLLEKDAAEFTNRQGNIRFTEYN